MSDYEESETGQLSVDRNWPWSVATIHSKLSETNSVVINLVIWVSFLYTCNTEGSGHTKNKLLLKVWMGDEGHLSMQDQTYF